MVKGTLRGSVKESGAFVECGIVLDLPSRTWRVWPRCRWRKAVWAEPVDDAIKFVPPR